jgi:2-dehydro-3-deoxyphosphogluconate aldolase/(4S)-4-hydroxy-2-oxoglutarate aldolase
MENDMSCAVNDTLKKIGDIGLVPVVVIDDPELAVPAAKALIDGGLETMEITMRTEHGVEAIKRVKRAFPQMLVGAGTVLSAEKARQAADAGAEFIVAPGLNPKVAEWCIEKDIAFTPGCVTPTEIDRALEYGFKVLKFFPSSVYGGLDGCRALFGPYRMVKFIPTGGINAKNLAVYADKPFVHAIGGGWLCSAAEINARNFGAITKTAREAIDILLGFEFAHIGINTENEEESLGVAKAISECFGFTLKQGNSSNFASAGIEVVKGAGPGGKGHIAVRTNSLGRAAYYLGKRGVSAGSEYKLGPNGKPAAVYLESEFAGFAVHLLQK